MRVHRALGRANGTVPGVRWLGSARGRDSARGATRVDVTSVRIVRMNREHRAGDSNENGFLRESTRRILSAMGITAACTGFAMTAYSHRPNRLSAGLLIGGTALWLVARPQHATPRKLAILGVTGAVLVFGPFYLQDRQAMQLQRVLIKAHDQLPWDPSIRFDDTGPAGHALTRPRHEYVLSPIQALTSGQSERVRIFIDAYTIRPTGEARIVSRSFIAERSYPWQDYRLVGFEEAESDNVH